VIRPWVCADAYGAAAIRMPCAPVERILPKVISWGWMAGMAALKLGGASSATT
jgi:hypothetical protein